MGPQRRTSDKHPGHAAAAAERATPAPGARLDHRGEGGLWKWVPPYGCPEGKLSVATKLHGFRCLWAVPLQRGQEGNTKGRCGVKLRLRKENEQRGQVPQEHACRQRQQQQPSLVCRDEMNSPRLLSQQLISHLIHYGMRWEDSFLFLTGVTDMKDTQRIPWKAAQSHPSRLPRPLAGIGAAGPGPAPGGVRKDLCRCSVLLPLWKTAEGLAGCFWW